MEPNLRRGRNRTRTCDLCRVNPIPGVSGRKPADVGGPGCLQLQGIRLLVAVGRTAANGPERQITREIRAMASRCGRVIRASSGPNHTPPASGGILTSRQL